MNKSAASVVGVSSQTFRAWRSFISIVTSPGGGVLDISLGGEVRRGPSYPDPV